mmetsp:Transcript_59608/g.129040  ORF Transcript_59608/g.129040 Transcript_59608/m.129040 type:complete len:374 (+) Transcript_59608:331-1452(+)
MRHSLWNSENQACRESFLVSDLPSADVTCKASNAEKQLVPAPILNKAQNSSELQLAGNAWLPGNIVAVPTKRRASSGMLSLFVQSITASLTSSSKLLSCMNMRSSLPALSFTLTELKHPDSSSTTSSKQEWLWAVTLCRPGGKATSSMPCRSVTPTSLPPTKMSTPSSGLLQQGVATATRSSAFRVMYGVGIEFGGIRRTLWKPAAGRRYVNLQSTASQDAPTSKSGSRMHTESPLRSIGSMDRVLAATAALDSASGEMQANTTSASGSPATAPRRKASCRTSMPCLLCSFPSATEKPVGMLSMPITSPACRRWKYSFNVRARNAPTSVACAWRDTRSLKSAGACAMFGKLRRGIAEMPNSAALSSRSRTDCH